MADNVIRTISFRGTSEGLDELLNKVKALAAAEKDLALVSDDLSKRQISLAAAWKNTGLRLDENARNLDTYNRLVKQSSALQAQGGITAEQHADRVKLLSERYGQATAGAAKLNTGISAVTQNTAALTKQSSRNAAEMLNLGRQFADVGVSLQAGQSLLTVGIQQGAQIIDVFASSGRTVGQIFSQAIGWAGKFAASTAGVVTGIAAIGAGALYAASSWQEGTKEIDRALIGVGKRAGLARDDIVALGDATAKSSRLSASELRSSALEFVKTGMIYGENITKVTKLVEGFAVQTGQSAQDASKALADIFGGDIVKGADKLDAVFGNISGKTRQYIVELDTMGERQKAISVLADAVAKDVKKAADTTGFWAASWQGVTKYSSQAFDAIGKGLSGLTGIGEDKQQARLSDLQTRLSFVEPGLKEQEIRGLDPQRLEKARAQVEALRDEIARLKKEMAEGTEQSIAEKIGKDADAAVRALVPFIQQLENVRKAQQAIAKAEATPGANQGLGQYNKQAADAAALQAINIREAADQSQRLNKINLGLLETYNTQSISVARTLDTQKDQLAVAEAVGVPAQLAAQEQARYNQLIREGVAAQDATRIASGETAIAQAQINSQARGTLAALQDQAAVAGAVGGKAKMAAQEQATYNALIRQGVSAQLAGNIAAQERANTQAQINAGAQETLLALQDQHAVAAAVTGQQKIQAQEQATLNALLRQGVDAELAMAIAAQQTANAIAAATAAVQQQTFSLKQQTELIYARMNGTEATVRAEQAFTNAIRSGAEASAARALQEATYANALAQNMERASSSTRRMADSMDDVADSAERFESSWDQLGIQRQKTALEEQVERTGEGRVVVGQRSITGAILSHEIEYDKSPHQAILDRAKERQDKLKENTEATKENTAATETMTDVLSPYYSSDPRRTHLGFRSFAAGGIMTAHGELPLKQYQGGGVASTPQVAVYGEGATPEAYVPVPSGRIPVEIKQPANSNQRPIYVMINVRGDADANTVSALKSTAYQQAQAMRRAMR